MKKLFLMFIILLLTGCSDYNELNDLRIVSAMIVDYKDSKYSVNLELLNTDEEAEKPAYFVEGTGKTFEESLNNIYNSSPFSPYLSHMKVVILSKTIAEEKLVELYDYFVRDPSVRKDFYVLLTDDIEKITEYEPEEKLSIGEFIKDLIENNKKYNSTFRTSEFREVLHAYLQENIYLLGNLSVEDDSLTLINNYVIYENKLNTKLGEEAVLFANILENFGSSFLYTHDESYEIYEYNTGIDVTKGKINITLDGEVRLLNMKETPSLTAQDLNKLEKKLEASIKKFFKNCIEHSKNINIDIYNFNYLYYRYFSDISQKDSWKDLNYEFKVDLAINEKGLILNSLGDEQK